jgi:hypothetical protein
MLNVIEYLSFRVVRVILVLIWSLILIGWHPLTGAQELKMAPGGSVRGSAVSETQERIVFDSSFLNGPRTASPYWENGYLISREIETFTPATPNVRLYDKSGRKVLEAAIWFPGAQRVLIEDATATSDGRIVASGIAEKSDGTAAPFIALTNLAGSVTDVVRPDGFYPANICLAPDNTVWSFGGTGYDSDSRPNPGDVLRHFDFQKGQIAAFIPRSTYPTLPVPDERASIRCSSTQAVVYASQVHEYIEIDYDSTSHRSYQTAAPPNLKFDGFAFQGPKKVFGYFANHLKNSDPAEGLYTLTFNESRKTADWVPVGGAVGPRTQSGVIRTLLGSDGQELVVSRVGDPAGNVAIHWVTPTRQQ